MDDTAASEKALIISCGVRLMKWLVDAVVVPTPSPPLFVVARALRRLLKAASIDASFLR